MGKKVAFIQNKYYTDDGMEYVFARLRDELARKGITLEKAELYACYPFSSPDFTHAVFWDKDLPLARRLESVGVRLINCADAVEICDDKQKTFERLDGKLDLPETVIAPLTYDVSQGDERFPELVERRIGYPTVVKELSGSQGRQVYLAEDRAELKELYRTLIHKPHLYQKFVGKERGTDVRVYIVGGKAVGAVKRTNTTDFRSNAATGGVITPTELTAPLKAYAELAAKELKLEYGSTDFIPCGDGYAFIEANSSAYMRGAESAGIPLAGLYADYIREVIYDSRR